MSSSVCAALQSKLRNASRISCCWVAVRSANPLQGAVVPFTLGIDGAGQLSALSAPLLSSDWVSRVFKLGSACRRGAHGSARPLATVGDELAVGEPLAEALAVADPLADPLAVGVEVLLAAVDGARRRSAKPCDDFVALPDPAPEPELVGLGDPLPAPEAEPLRLGCTGLLLQVIGCAGPMRPRKFRTAALPSRLTSAPVPLGISITSWSLPCTTTVAPAQRLRPPPRVGGEMVSIFFLWVLCPLPLLVFLGGGGGGAPFGGDR